MAENFYTMLTIIGKNKILNSAVSGSKVNFKTLKVGDGKGTYYEPSENQTSLVNEVWSGNVSSISVDEANSNWIIVETVIPATDGSFFIREAGIFDEDGDMIAVSKLAETYKPVVSEGSTKDLVIKIVLEVSNVDSVSLKIDPNVTVATKSDVQVLESEIQEINGQVSEKTNNTDSTRTTTDKTVTGAINELNTGKASKDGTLQNNLNADMLDGLHSSKFGKLYINSNEKDISDANVKELYVTNTTNNDNVPDSSWWHVINLPHCNNDGFCSQIAVPYGNALSKNIYFRTSTNTIWDGWKQVATTETATLTLLNGWVNQIGDTRISKTGNQVIINAVLMNGVTIANTIFASIPAGFRPSVQRYFMCDVANSSWTYFKIGILINSDGSIVFDGIPSGNTRLVCNMSYTV